MALFHLAAISHPTSQSLRTQQLSLSQEFPFAIVNSEAQKFGIDFWGVIFLSRDLFFFFFSFVGSSGNFVFSIVALIIPFT